MSADFDTISQKLSELEAKVDAVHASSEKIRKYFLWTGVITILIVVLPLFLLPLVIPAFLQSMMIPSGF